MASLEADASGRLASLRGVIDRYYLLLLAVVAAAVLACNYLALGQSGMTLAFLDIRDVIRAGFDPTQAARFHAPTSPMWGYAWVFLLTESKAVILPLQNLLMLVAVGYCVHVLRRTGALTAAQLTLAKLLLIVSVPWIAFHSVRWEAPIASSLLVLGIAALADGLHRGLAVSGRLLLSALFLGLAANFRSDSLMAALFLAPCVLIFARLRPRAILATVVWLAGIGVMLVPWGLYTRHVCGQYLLTSTNGGVTAINSFGANPHNRWGITSSDEDPYVWGLVRDNFPPGTSPCNAAADRFLKAHFREMIRQYPGEFIRKFALVLGQQIVKGVYPAEFYFRLSGIQGDARADYVNVRSAALRQPVQFVREHPGDMLILLAQLASSFFGKLVILLSWLVSPFVFVHMVRQRNAFLLCALVAMVYKIVLVAGVAVADPRFTTPVYPFHIINLVVGLTLVCGWIARRRAGQPLGATVAAPR